MFLLFLIITIIIKGIGATKKTMDNWLDNTNAFSELLKKLNERVESGNVSDDDSSKDDKKPIAYGRLQ